MGNTTRGSSNSALACSGKSYQDAIARICLLKSESSSKSAILSDVHPTSVFFPWDVCFTDKLRNCASFCCRDSSRQCEPEEVLRSVSCHKSTLYMIIMVRTDKNSHETTRKGSNNQRYRDFDVCHLMHGVWDCENTQCMRIFASLNAATGDRIHVRMSRKLSCERSERVVPFYPIVRNTACDVKRIYFGVAQRSKSSDSHSRPRYRREAGLIWRLLRYVSVQTTSFSTSRYREGRHS